MIKEAEINLILIKVGVSLMAVVFGIMLIINVVLNVFNLENVLKLKKYTYDYQKTFEKSQLDNKKKFLDKQSKKSIKIKSKKEELQLVETEIAELQCSLDMLKDELSSIATGGVTVVPGVEELLKKQFISSEKAIVQLKKKSEQISNDILTLEKDFYIDYNISYAEDLNWQFIMSLAVILEKKENPHHLGETFQEETIQKVLDKCLAKTEFVTQKQITETMENSVYDPITKTLIRVTKPFGKVYKIKNIKFNLKDYSTIYKDFNLSEEEIEQMNQSLSVTLDFDFSKLQGQGLDFNIMSEKYIKGQMSEMEVTDFFKQVEKAGNVELIDKPSISINLKEKSSNDSLENAIQSFIKLDLTYFPENQLTQNVISYQDKSQIESTIPKGKAFIDNLINKYIGYIQFVDNKFAKVLNIISLLRNKKFEDVKALLSGFDIGNLVGVDTLTSIDPIADVLNMSQEKIIKLNNFKERLSKYKDKITYFSNILERLDNLTNEGKELFKNVSKFPSDVTGDWKALTEELKDLPEEEKEKYIKTIEKISSLDDETKRIVNLKLNKLDILVNLDNNMRNQAESLINSLTAVSSVSNIETIINKVSNFDSNTKFYYSKLNTIIAKFPSDIEAVISVNTYSLSDASLIKINKSIIPYLKHMKKEEIAFLNQAINSSSIDLKNVYKENGRSGVIKDTREMLSNASLSVDNIDNVCDAIIGIISLDKEIEKFTKLTSIISINPDPYFELMQNIFEIPTESLNKIRGTFNEISNVPLMYLRDVNNVVKKVYLLPEQLTKDCLSISTSFVNIAPDTLRKAEEIINSIIDTPLEISNTYMRTISSLLTLPTNSLLTYSNALQTVLSFPKEKLEEFNLLIDQAHELGSEATDLIFDITQDEEIRNLLETSLTTGFDDFYNFLDKFSYEDSAYLQEFNNKIKGLNQQQLAELNNLLKTGDITAISNKLKTFLGENFFNQIISKYKGLFPFLEKASPMVGYAKSALGFNHYSQYYTKYELESDKNATEEANKMKDLSFNNQGYLSYNKGTDNLQMVLYIYKLLGIQLHNNRKDLFNSGNLINKDQLRKGDLAFKNNPNFTKDDYIAIFYKKENGINYFITYDAPFNNFYAYDNKKDIDYQTFKGGKIQIKPLPDFNLFRTLWK